MSYLSDWAEAERRANPDKFLAEMDRIRWRHVMRMLSLATIEFGAAVSEAADRLDEILR